MVSLGLLRGEEAISVVGLASIGGVAIVALSASALIPPRGETASVLLEPAKLKQPLLRAVSQSKEEDCR